MTAPAPMLLSSRTGEPLILESVNASGQLHDALLTMSIEQRYRNPSQKYIEAVYTFPLPWGAVLMAVEVDLGGKPLSGQVHARPQAEAKYENALSEGDAAILLERNRDGSHTLNLGNLAPAEQCSIRIRYAQSMSVEQGSLRLMLPTVIAPRYGDPESAGLQPQQVAKVDWLAAYPLEVTVDIFGSLAAARVASPSHPISVGPVQSAAGAPGVRVSLSRDSWLDRDVVLLLGPVAHDSLGQALADPFTPGQIAVKLALKPRVPVRASPLRLKILVDCSGSMGGDSIAAARRALESIVTQLGENERFSLSRFGSRFEHRSRTLWAVTAATRQGAQRWVKQLEADLGGTAMEEALASTFGLYAGTHTEQADVLLVTDGQINSVTDTVALARASGHRVFVVGIGTAANDQLIYQLAETTGGACEFVAPGEAVAPAVLRMFHRLRGGHVSDLRLHWPDGMQPVWQQTLPKSVFDGDTVHIHAQFAAPLKGTLRLAGRLQTDSEPLDLAELTLLPNPENTDSTDSEASTLARMVAWAQIKEWMPSSAKKNPQDKTRQRITDVAVTYQLVTEESCFVLTHERAAADKALDMPEQTRIKQMLAAGWAGTASVGLFDDNDIRFSRGSSSGGLSAQSSMSVPSIWRTNRSVAAASSDMDDVFFSASLNTQHSASAPSRDSWLGKMGKAVRSKLLRNQSSDIPSFLQDDMGFYDEPLQGLEGIDRRDARLWSQDAAYTGLTPLGLAQWLGEKPAAQWPADIDALAEAGVGQAVLDWLEFVLAARLGDAALPALLRWLASAEVLASLRTDSTAALPGELAQSLAGITASAWPAQVFALEEGAAASI